MKTQVLSHLTSHLGPGGKPIIDSPDLSVFAWPWLHGNEEVALATVGMSAKKQRLPAGAECVSAEPRTELFMFSPEEQGRNSAELLNDLAAYPFRTGTFLHWWHTLPLGRPVVPGSPLDCLLFSFPPIEEKEFATFAVEGHRIDLVWVMPISRSEFEYAKVRGVEALEELLEKSNVVSSDLWRQPVV
jgi:hypothetical protein